MIKKYTNNSWEESGYEKLETVNSVGGYRMGFNGSGEPLDDYTIKGGVFQTKNLCTLMLEGVVINTTNGTETTNASYKSSQFIPVDFDNIPEYVINAQTLSGCHISGYDAQHRYCGRTDTGRTNIGTIIKSDSFIYGTPASTEPVKYIRICCNKSSVDVKFSEAVTPNNVIPVQGTGDEVKIIIDQPLRAVDSENCDTIDLATKTYTKRITDEIILTGDEDWSISGVSKLTYYIGASHDRPTTRKSNTDVITNDTIVTGGGGYLGYGSWATQVKFHGGDASYTVDDLKAYLREKYNSGNPVKVWYCMGTGYVVTKTLDTIPDGMTGVVEGTFTQTQPTEGTVVDTTFKGDLQPDGTYSVYSTYKITIASGEQSILLDEPLRAIGDYKDTINLATKVYTKRIQELVLTGEESWVYSSYGHGSYVRTDNKLPSNNSTGITTISNYYEGKNDGNNVSLFNVYGGTYSVFGFGRYIGITNDNYETVEDFQSYLAEQYAAGTPVKVWYVLAEPIVSTLDSIPDGLTGIIEGTGYQSGTPTPNNPIEPVFNGELQYNSGKYKIIVSPNNTLSDIYLGQVPTTRRIKKLILTGKETSWQISSSLFRLRWLPRTVEDQKCMSCCNHFLGTKNTPITMVSNLNDISCCMRNGEQDLFLRYDAMGLDIEAFKAYLATQYAAGTPVTVWYVLAEPEVGIVNEPLMQIGEYADSITYEQANVPIPTSKGDTSLVIPTHVPPSEVTISTSGWHLHKNAKKYHNGKWEATSWEGFRDMVIDGTAPQVYPLGTILYDDWGNTNSTGFQIVGYDVDEYMDPDMTAQGYTHNCVLCTYNTMDFVLTYQYHGTFLFLERELPIGTYRFTLGDKTYMFTTTKTTPMNGMVGTTADASVVSTWREPGGSMIHQLITTVWDGETESVDLGTIKRSMNDPDSSFGKLNEYNRSMYANNNYYQSGIRQFINSDSPANTWWVPQDIFSRTYQERTIPGFLYNLTKEFKSVLATPKIECITNTIFETGGIDGEQFDINQRYYVRDKMFLLSHTNINGTDQPALGSVLPFYVNATNADRIKTDSKGNAHGYVLRTPYINTYPTRSLRVINEFGQFGTLGSATNGYYNVMGCVIQGIPGSRNTVYTTSDGEVYTTSDGKPYKVYQD